MPYVPHTEAERKRMLETIGVENIDRLFDCIPEELRLERPLDLPGPLGEMELIRHAQETSRENIDPYGCTSFIGAGIYDHYIPATVGAVVSRSEFYTAYTPYQPEISQGTLQSIWEFQTLICRLTGMDIANASMYDASTALAEAVIMASHVTGRPKWVVSECLHPSYREVMRTYAWASGYEIIESGREGFLTDTEKLAASIDNETACVVVQSPNFLGSIESLRAIGEAAHAAGALFVVAYDPISLGLLKPPAEYDADICVGEGQPLGIPMRFGGPLLGMFACKQKYTRQMPGRIVGATVDGKGQRGYTLTLQTREQHIRREKATSNICSNEALCALAASVYLATLGKTGLKQVAGLCLQQSHYAAEKISALPGYEVPLGIRFFKEFPVKCKRPVSEVNEQLLARNMIGGLDLGRYYPDMENHMLLCVTEKRTREDIDRLVEGLAK